MVVKGFTVLPVVFLAIFSLLLVGCNGGGSSGGGAATALTVAEKVSVVDAQSSISKVAPLAIGKLYLSTSDIPANSDYFNDRQVVFVEERSAEAFDEVNEILCMLAQSEYDAMLNQGAYKAQIDMNKCESSNDSASSAGQSSQNQSSGSTAPDYENWTVESSRTDANSPHIVKFWVHAEADEEMPGTLIYAKLTITESATSTNPYGIFTLYFIEYPEVNGTVDTSKTVFKGYIKTEEDSTGQVLLKFVVNGSFDGGEFGSFSFDEKFVLNRSADGSTGSGTTSMSVISPMDNKSAQYNIAFNSANFLRNDGTNDKCYSRTSFDETVWRYGLYGSNGSRVTLNAGFPIKKDTYYGWIGYYGLWFPESVTINDGDTVYKLTYSASGETATAYTVIKKGGKLRKHTRHTTTLSGIKNIPLDWWECSQSGCTGYRVRWSDEKNGATDGTFEFVKFAQQNSQSYMWENMQTEAAIDVNSLNYGELNFWSQALGGQVRVPLSCSGWDSNTNKPTCSAPNNNTQVIYFTENIVYPGDTVPSSLRCYDNCPVYDATSGVTGSGWGGDPNNPTAYNYTFSASASGMVLKDGSNRDMLLTQASGNNQWGFMSGPLFEASASNLALLDCNFDGDNNPATNVQTCVWNAWSALSTYYTWETGTQQWNQFTALKDPTTGTPLTFDAPLQAKYTHSQTDNTKPDYKYNGATFYLEYNGFGDLWGIPGKCVNWDTGADTSCSGGDVRWIPEFSIPDGSELSNSSNDTIKYLAKALEKEQRMSNVATSNCSALTLTSYTLSSISDWADPAIGDEPTVNNAPAVIGGVLQ